MLYYFHRKCLKGKKTIFKRCNFFGQTCFLHSGSQVFAYHAYFFTSLNWACLHNLSMDRTSLDHEFLDCVSWTSTALATAKNQVFIELTWKLVFSVGNEPLEGDKNLGQGESVGVFFLLQGEGRANFWLSGWEKPWRVEEVWLILASDSLCKTLNHKSEDSCQKVLTGPRTSFVVSLSYHLVVVKIKTVTIFEKLQNVCL